MPTLPDFQPAAAEAGRRDLPAVGPEDFPQIPVLADAVSSRFLQEMKAVPLEDGEAGVVVALAEPDDAFALAALRLAFGKPVLARRAAPAVIESAFERLYGPGKSALEQIVDDIGAEPAEGERGEEDIEQLKDLALEAPVVRLVNQLVAEAVQLRASDIHIEPFRQALTVRFRIDGLLREIKPPPARLGKAIVSRIKILAGLNIAERRLPQDGRARFKLEDRQLDLRVATMPTMHGESVVIRLLEDSGQVPELAGLGLSARDDAALRRHLAAPYGMIVVTGPTGSGKTTTLAAALALLNRPQRKIVTVEDPIEYQIAGVNQLQVKPQIGLSFANALRAFVRQDPDVIMVGEMRDGETADIAVHAALTGHLVLTTLHTNDAAGAVTRLLDMGVDGYLLASTLRCLVAQRLVRLLCPACREPYPAPEELLAPLRAAGRLPDGREPRFYRAVGCEACGGSGYGGRIGIFEILEIGAAVEPLIRPGVAAGEIAAAARRAGMTTMLEDGLGKCLAGRTSIEEVRRVTEDT